MVRERVSVDPGVAECAIFPDGGVESLGRLPFHSGVGRDHHLADALSVVDREGLVGEVDHDYADFATVVGIHRAGGVDDGDAAAQGEAAAGADLALITLGELHVKARGNQCAFHGLEHYGFLQEGPDIHSGISGGGIFREGVVRAVYDFYFELMHCG